MVRAASPKNEQRIDGSTKPEELYQGVWFFPALLTGELAVEEIMKHSYDIDGQEFAVDLGEDSNFRFGENETLIDRFGDLTRPMDWFDKGFSIEKSSRFYDIEKLYAATENAIIDIIHKIDPSLPLEGFSLEKYHKYVSDELHGEVIKKTKRLFPEDLDLDVSKILVEFSGYFDTKLTFLNPVTKSAQWMIARINKPNSNNYNTAHKDVYEHFDKFGDIPRMVNIWIPLCGVNSQNSLPISPSSHLISENLVKRTKAGSTMNGTPYSVASIKSWDRKSSLSRADLNKDDVLIFSSHLIHGLAVNKSENTTRMSFEFRLYEETGQS